MSKKEIAVGILGGIAISAVVMIAVFAIVFHLDALLRGVPL